MPEKLNNVSEIKAVARWMIIIIFLIACWSSLEYYYELPFIFISSILFMSIIICGIYYGIQNKYLISAIYLLAIIHDIIIVSLIGNKLGVARGFLGYNFFIFIYLSFYLFSIRMIKNEKRENKEARREAIIKKLLWLIFALIVIVVFYCIFFFNIFK